MIAKSPRPSLSKGERSGLPCRFVCAAIALFFCVACNVGGYPDLGSRLDTLVSIGDGGATAWMKTDDEGASDILVLGDTADADTGRFALLHLRPNSTGTLRVGTYVVDDERIMLSVESEYRKISQLDVPPSARDGSVREDFDPPTVLACEADMVDGKLDIMLDGNPSLMTNLWDVISTVDPAAQGGAAMLCRFFNLPVVSLQMRIPGFGGAGLLQYSGEPSNFAGVIGGKGSIRMTSVLSPTAEIAFADFRDFPGITVDGYQISATDMAGDGSLTGTMNFTMQDPRLEGAFSVSGEISYDMVLRNGTPSDGGYNVTLSNGTSDFVSYKDAETLDFRSVLPPS